MIALSLEVEDYWHREDMWNSFQMIKKQAPRLAAESRSFWFTAIQLVSSE